MVANHSAHLQPSTKICMEESTFHDISTNFASSQQGVLVFSFCYISGGHGMPQVGNMLYSMCSKTSMSTQTNHEGEDKTLKYEKKSQELNLFEKKPYFCSQGFDKLPS